MSNLEVRLNITNYNPHPENPNYTVFHFYRDDLATEFEALLLKHEIPYEKAIEEEKRKIYLFGVKNSYYKQTVKLNFLAIGKHREPFIPSRFWGILLIVFVFLLIVLSIVGYVNG